MHSQPSRLDTARYYTKLILVYCLTVLAGWLIIHPPDRSTTNLASLSITAQASAASLGKPVTGVSGQPVRIVIPDSGIDLPIDPGEYNTDSGEWSISGYHAQFALLSSLSNTVTGDTLIYGHNNNYVFGALRHNTPAVGAEAHVYTDNGHIFQYRFASSESLTPDDTSALNYHGPPRMTVLTCTGALNEWRTFYHFTFDRLVQ